MTVQEAIKELQVGYLGDTEEIVQAKHMGIKALEKQIPKKPNFEQKGLLGVKMWHCPVCNKEIISDWNKDFANNYCHHCGQKLDWEEGGTSD